MPFIQDSEYWFNDFPDSSSGWGSIHHPTAIVFIGYVSWRRCLRMFCSYPSADRAKEPGLGYWPAVTHAPATAGSSRFTRKYLVSFFWYPEGDSWYLGLWLGSSPKLCCPAPPWSAYISGPWAPIWDGRSSTRLEPSFRIPDTLFPLPLISTELFYNLIWS